MRSLMSASVFLIVLTAMCLNRGFSAGLEEETRDQASRREVYQKALNLQSGLIVLSLAIEPGFEDLSALSYLRFGRGAKIVSAFITNGESGDLDSGTAIPGEVAFLRRGEAFRAVSAFQGTEHFLNFPDFGSARDTGAVYDQWDPDSLTERLVELIESVRPDVMLLAPDLRHEGWASPRWGVVRKSLLEAAKAAGEKKTRAGFVRPRAWKVQRILAAVGEGPFAFPVQRKAEFRSNTYDEIGSTIGMSYESLAIQRPLRLKGTRISYEIDLGSRRRLKAPDAGLPVNPARNLAWIGSQVQELSSFVMKNAVKTRGIEGLKGRIVKWIVSVMDSVDVRFSRWGSYPNDQKKTLLQWKEGLEELRNSVLGLAVRYTLKDTVLLARQLTTLRIDTVLGIASGGAAELFIPEVGPRWFLNEDVQAKVPLSIGIDYRLISPTSVELDLPASYGGRGKSTVGTPLEFFVLHQGKSRTESFFKKISRRILYAPKLTVELLTPIIRITPGERVVYRITNHSNDGILDALGVSDSLASATPKSFRLNRKGLSVVDTLNPVWKSNIAEGTYRVPLEIGGSVVGFFGARKFDVVVDSVKRIGIVSATNNGVLEESLRRLGIKTRLVEPQGFRQGALASLDVLILDERVSTLRPAAVASHDSFDEFVNSGGALVVLSQDAESWKQHPLLQGLSLSATTLIDSSIPVAMDSLHSLSAFPNKLDEDDWGGWLFSRATNVMSVPESGDIKVPVRLLGVQTPAVVIKKVGKGKIIYVNLTLGKQLMNIHPGAFRFLANLLSI